jgi:hypothetical protein
VVYLLSVVLIDVKKKENDGSAPDNAQQAPSEPPAHSSAPTSGTTSSGCYLEYSATINYYTVCSIVVCPGFSPLQSLCKSSDSSKSVKQDSEDIDSSKKEEKENSSEASVENGMQQPFSQSERLPSRVTPPLPRRTTTPSHHSFCDFPSDRKGVHYSMGSKVMRAVFSIFAFDWIILYFVYTLAWFVFRSQQAFLTGKYMIHTTHKKALRDACRDLARLRKYAANAQLCRLPLCDGWVVTDTADTVKDRNQEDAEWKEVEKTMPSYSNSEIDVRKVLEAMSNYFNPERKAESQESFPYVFFVLCHLFIILWRVGKTFFGMIFLCMGIWPDWLVRDFKIIEKFQEFKRLNEAIYRQVGNGVFLNPLEDAFTKIDNDEGVSFGQFVSAVTMCRIALLQIEPSLTVWAVFASSVAASPLLVCEAMHKKLPPLFATDAFQRAYDLLDKTYFRKPPIIQTAFLGWYIFVNQSRIIQFMLAGFLNIISIGIIFFPQHLKNLIPPLVVLIVHYGLLQSIYVVYMFKKLLFPEVTEEISQMEGQALDDDNNVTRGDIELMQGPKDSPCETTNSAATPANPTSSTPDDIPPEDGSTSEIDDSSQMPWMGTSIFYASSSPSGPPPTKE